MKGWISNPADSHNTEGSVQEKVEGRTTPCSYILPSKAFGRSSERDSSLAIEEIVGGVNYLAR